jgi:hypothetical protein
MMKSGKMFMNGFKLVVLALVMVCWSGCLTAALPVKVASYNFNVEPLDDKTSAPDKERKLLTDGIKNTNKNRNRSIWNFRDFGRKPVEITFKLAKPAKLNEAIIYYYRYKRGYGVKTVSIYALNGSKKQLLGEIKPNQPYATKDIGYTEFRIPLNNITTGKVMVKIKGTSYLGLTEIEFFGHSSKSQSTSSTLSSQQTDVKPVATTKKSKNTIKPVIGNKNLITNGSFEDYQNGVLKNWVIHNGGELDYNVVSDAVATGKYALRLNGASGKKFSIRITNILLQKDFQYRLGMQMKSSGFTNFKQGFAVVIDRKWKWQSKRLILSKANSDWKHYTIDFTAPATALYRFVIFKSPSMKGELYFDDVQLKRLYQSAGIEFDFSNKYVVGKGSLAAKLINYQHENSSFSVKAKLTSATDKKLIFNETQTVKLTAADQDKVLSFNYDLKTPGYYNLTCNVTRNGELVDTMIKQLKFVEQIGISLIKPNMRKLYRFPHTKNLITDIIFNRQINQPCTLELMLAERGKSDKITGKRVKLTSSKTTRFTTDISALPFGRYDIIAILRDRNKIISQTRQPLDIINPDQGVAIDENHNLIVDGKLFFPWGFTGNMVVHREFKRLKAAGFNVLMFYAPNGVDAYRKYLDKLHEAGMKGIPYIARLRKNHKLLKQLVKELRDHPALLAYDIADEPGGQSMDQFYDAYNIITDLDPHHPVMAIMADHNTYHKYVNIVDLFAVDPYPNSIPKVHQSLVYKCVNKAVKITNKPVWDIPPTMERTKYFPILFVAPTPAELKNIFYLAIVGGSKGMISYTYNNYRKPRTKNPKDYLHYKDDNSRIYIPDLNPSMWQTCTNMSKDIKILNPFIFAPSSDKKLTLSTQKKVYALYKTWSKKCAGLIVNSEPKSVTMTVKLPGDFSGELLIPITGKKIKANNGEFNITLKALEELYFEY